MHHAWKRNGPPLNIAAIAIAASLGVKLLDRRGDDDPLPELDMDGATPKLTDIHGEITLPAPGGDTLAASRAIVERLKGRL